MDEKKLQSDFEFWVQSIYNTAQGKQYFVRLAIMTNYFENSLVASARIKATTGCEAPLMYLEAQRDLARKSFNCLTSSQHADLRDSVLSVLFHREKKGVKENG